MKDLDTVCLPGDFFIRKRGGFRVKKKKKNLNNKETEKMVSKGFL